MSGRSPRSGTQARRRRDLRRALGGALARTTRPRLARVVVRPRLFRLLHRHRDRSIHWVTGPAGSGKTTLVASYLDAHRIPSIWYRLDPGDADAATFFHHMGLAVQRAVPRGWKPLPTLGPEHYLDLLAFSRRYFRELYARFPGPFYHLWMGDLAGATRTIDTFDKDVRAPGSTALAEVVWCAAEAYHAWQTAAPGASLRAVARGLEAARVSGVHIFDAELFGQGAYAALQMGDFDTARGFLEKMGGALDRRRTLDAAHYHSVAAWVALLQRALPLAREHGETAVRLDPGSPIPHAQNCLLLAGVLHEQGDEVQARARLGEARAIGEQVGSQQLRFMSLLTAAHFALDRDATPEALASLRDALALGRRNGYLATPCWRPSVMSRLCATALRARIEVEYVQTLVRRRGLSPDPTAVDVGDWPWTFRIVTLGEFRLEREGEEVRSAGKAQHRPLAMLKVLIARGGREVPEADLSDALWPDAEGDVAHTSFATTLHRLRKLLGHPRALVLHGGRLSLDPRMCWLDVWAFERLLDEVEAAERGGRRDRAREQAALALDLYRGPFLARDAGAPWAVLARERLRRRFLGAVARLGQVWEDAGQWLRAIECYERGLDADQLAEEFYRRQIVCYGRLGRRAEARAVYERCRRTLLAGLGVLPSAETEALHRRLSAGT